MADEAIKHGITRRELFKKAAATVVLSAAGIPFLASKAEADTIDDYLSPEGKKRRDFLRGLTGNESALPWQTKFDEYGIKGNRNIFKELASKEFDFSYEFTPYSINTKGVEGVDQTWSFDQGIIYLNNRLDFNRNATFLYDTGKMSKIGDPRSPHSGLYKILDKLPALKPLIYHSAVDKNGQISNPYGKHALFIGKDQIPEYGYVMVFSRPDKDEKPNALYDVWEEDTDVVSDRVRVLGGQHGENPVEEGHFLLISSQDKTDRLTPFYNKDNPAQVQKVVVILDITGQAVSKFTLDKTPFYPKADWIDGYQGSPNLVLRP